MHFLRQLAGTAVLMALVALAAWKFGDVPRSSPRGDVSVEPDSGVAGQYGTWCVTFRVGKSGIRAGGGIRVQLPDSWHAGERNSGNSLQASDPKGDHYISARCSRAGVRLKTEVEGETRDKLVKSARRGLDGRSERYIFVVRAVLQEGRLEEGDTITVVYGDTSGGSRGMRAADISTVPEPVLVAVDAAGTGQHELLADRPTMLSRGGPAAELLVTGPSTLLVGRPAEVHLAFVDANANPAGSTEDEISLRVVEGSAEAPARVPFPGPQAWHTVSIIPKEEGFLRLEASDRSGRLRAVGNPMKVHAREPELKVYWGDLHSHTRYSWDGVGDGSFDYARFVSGLDFYAMTDHSIAVAEGRPPQGLSDHVWQECVALTEKYYKPGTFATLHAYEASFGAPFGHHNVYFRGKPGPLLSPTRMKLPEMWKRLTAGEALTIPHHTGKFPEVTWDADDPELRRNIEIYSGHGLSEAYDPSHPLAFEQSDFTAPSKSRNGPSFAQDAWIRGLRMSTIAASDDHRSHPGQPHWGLAAVWATGLTREGIFEALHRRRTYGTTGARILLDFTVEGTAMGQETMAAERPKLRLAARGTAEIELAEVLRFGRSEGKFTVIQSLKPGKPDIAWEGTDDAFKEDAIYYVRLRQAGRVRNRVAMAWSSPIWVKRRSP